MGMHLCTSYTIKRNDTRSHTVRQEAYLREALRRSWGIVLAAVLRTISPPAKWDGICPVSGTCVCSLITGSPSLEPSV